ncbi:MAG: protein kinase, partial [Verrucomicrobiota bacterium]
HEVGPASDVYSLGAILYQLLTGKAPFAGATPLAIIRQVLETEPIAPSKLDPRTPPELETICLKCLEKRPERRYHSARELAEELGRFLNHEPILAKPASAWRKAWSWSLRNPWAIIGVAAVVGLVLLGFAYGLWERVKYLEGSTPSKFYDPFTVFHVMVTTFCSVLIPGLLFGRWLKGRRQRNLPVSNVQLALLAGTGLVLIAMGLWSDMIYIRLYVWKKPLFFDSPAAAEVVAACLGLPLFSCWVGGILIWQAIRRQQAHWSGSTAVEEEWLPRQALHYSTVAFTMATFANLVLFVSAAQLGIATGLFDRVLNVVGPSRDGKIVLSTFFALIALVVSTACWVYATRKVYKRPPLVSAFLGVVFVGFTVGWFTAPPYSWLPASFVFTSMLGGLVGGWVLVKWVKIRKVEAAEPEAPLVLGELFQCDRRAFAITLAGVFVTLGLLTALFSRESHVPFFAVAVWTVWNALVPVIFLAVRATTGKLRELFLSILLGLVLLDVVFAIGVPLGDESGIKSTVFLHWLATVPIGLAAGCALVYFGKIRPKAR